MNKIRKLQLHQLDMLKQLITLFEEQGLTYFAIGGTALGASRHQGFIPWDDDIDIAMPRADYDKFLTLQSKLPENFFLQHHLSDPEYPLYIAKVRDTNTLFVERRYKDLKINHGIFIDIFPWDNIYDLKEQKKQVHNKMTEFRRCKKQQRQQSNVFKSLKTFFYKAKHGFKSSKEQFIEIDKAHQQYNHLHTGVIGNANFDDAISEDNLYPLRKMKFETIEINCPNNIAKYLTDKYGDYMTIPDEKDRITHNPVEIKFDVTN